MRLRDNASYETIEERTLSEADRKVGIEFDRVVWLGSKQKRNNFSKPMRIIQLHYYDERALLGHKRKSRVSSKKTFRTRSPEHTLLLATDRMDLSAELNGITIQVSCALIASLLIRLWTGPQANQTYLRNGMFVLSGMGFPRGTHRTYRRSYISRPKTAIVV